MHRSFNRRTTGTVSLGGQGGMNWAVRESAGPLVQRTRAAATQGEKSEACSTTPNWPNAANASRGGGCSSGQSAPQRSERSPAPKGSCRLGSVAASGRFPKGHWHNPPLLRSGTGRQAEEAHLSVKRVPHHGRGGGFRAGGVAASASPPRATTAASTVASGGSGTSTSQSASYRSPLAQRGKAGFLREPPSSRKTLLGAIPRGTCPPGGYASLCGKRTPPPRGNPRFSPAHTPPASGGVSRLPSTGVPLRRRESASLGAPLPSHSGAPVLVPSSTTADDGSSATTARRMLPSSTRIPSTRLTVPPTHFAVTRTPAQSSSKATPPVVARSLCADSHTARVPVSPTISYSPRAQGAVPPEKRVVRSRAVRRRASPLPPATVDQANRGGASPSVPDSSPTKEERKMRMVIGALRQKIAKMKQEAEREERLKLEAHTKYQEEKKKVQQIEKLLHDKTRFGGASSSVVLAPGGTLLGKTAVPPTKGEPAGTSTPLSKQSGGGRGGSLLPHQEPPPSSSPVPVPFFHQFPKNKTPKDNAQIVSAVLSAVKSPVPFASAGDPRQISTAQVPTPEHKNNNNTANDVPISSDSSGASKPVKAVQHQQTTVTARPKRRGTASAVEVPVVTERHRSARSLSNDGQPGLDLSSSSVDEPEEDNPLVQNVPVDKPIKNPLAKSSRSKTKKSPGTNLNQVEPIEDTQHHKSHTGRSRRRSSAEAAYGGEAASASSTRTPVKAKHHHNSATKQQGKRATSKSMESKKKQSVETTQSLESRGTSRSSPDEPILIGGTSANDLSSSSSPSVHKQHSNKRNRSTASNDDKNKKKNSNKKKKKKKRHGKRKASTATSGLSEDIDDQVTAHVAMGQIAAGQVHAFHSGTALLGDIVSEKTHSPGGRGGKGKKRKSPSPSPCAAGSKSCAREGSASVSAGRRSSVRSIAGRHSRKIAVPPELQREFKRIKKENFILKQRVKKATSVLRGKDDASHVESYEVTEMRTMMHSMMRFVTQTIGHVASTAASVEKEPQHQARQKEAAKDKKPRGRRQREVEQPAESRHQAKVKEANNDTSQNPDFAFLEDQELSEEILPPPNNNNHGDHSNAKRERTVHVLSSPNGASSDVNDKNQSPSKKQYKQQQQKSSPQGAVQRTQQAALERAQKAERALKCVRQELSSLKKRHEKALKEKEDQADHLETSLARAKRSLETSEAHMAIVEEKLRKKQSEAQLLQDALNSERDLSNRYKKERDEALDMSEQYKTEKAVLHEENHKLRQQLVQLRQEANQTTRKLRKNLAEKTEAAEDLFSTVRELRESVAALKQRENNHKKEEEEEEEESFSAASSIEGKFRLVSCTPTGHSEEGQEREEAEMNAPQREENNTKDDEHHVDEKSAMCMDAASGTQSDGQQRHPHSDEENYSDDDDESLSAQIEAQATPSGISFSQVSQSAPCTNASVTGPQVGGFGQPDRCTSSLLFAQLGDFEDPTEEHEERQEGEHNSEVCSSSDDEKTTTQEGLPEEEEEHSDSGDNTTLAPLEPSSSAASSQVGRETGSSAACSDVGTSVVENSTGKGAREKQQEEGEELSSLPGVGSDASCLKGDERKENYTSPPQAETRDEATTSARTPSVGGEEEQRRNSEQIEASQDAY